MRKSSSEETIDSSEDEPPQPDSCEPTFNVVQRRSNIEVPDGSSGNSDPNSKVEMLKSSSSQNSEPVADRLETLSIQSKNKVIKQRRTTVPEKPNISFSLWSIMKNCIGKDLNFFPTTVGTTGWNTWLGVHAVEEMA